MDRRTFLKTGAQGFVGAVAFAAVSHMPSALAMPVNLNARVLSFFNTHTNETLTTQYRQASAYQPNAFRQIDHVLRDHRTGDTHAMDPRLMDLLYDLKRTTGTRAPFNVISGYRSPKTNAMLHEMTPGVASNSYHIKGMAIDIRLPDVPLHALREHAMKLQRGGVGIYTSSDFVHVDVGPVRHWGS